MPHNPQHVISEKAKIRLMGTPEQRRRVFESRQAALVASLPPEEQKILKGTDFTTRLRIIRSRLGASGVAGFPAQTGVAFRHQEGFRQAQTGFVAGPFWQGGFSRLIGAQGQELARHEITHQTLAPQGLTFEQEHAIIRQTGTPTEAQRGLSTSRGAALSPSNQIASSKSIKEKQKALKRLRRKFELRTQGG